MLLDGKSASYVSRRFEISYQSVQRHRKNHLIKAVRDEAKYQKTMNEVSDNLPKDLGDSFGVDIPSNFKYYHSQLLICYQSALAQNDLGTAIKALREARECSTTVLKTMNSIKKRGKKDDFRNIISNIMNTLKNYPEARISVSRALDGIDL
jgi:hypothetical protein